MPKVIKNCKTCSKEMVLYPSHAVRIYCSRKCKGEASKGVLRPRVNLPRPCKVCNTVFTGHSQTSKYCSHSCYAQDLKQARNCKECGNMMPAQCDSDTLTVLCSSKCLQQSRDNRKLFVDCRECGKKFHAYPSNNSQYCSRECSDTGHQDRSIERFASGKSKPSKRKTYPYGKVLLDSSWELALVEKLDALNVYWVREYPLKYTDRNGKIRTFFLDFYLPEHNKGIEVKAPYTLELNGSKESDKIAYIKQYYPNITWLWSLKDCQTFKMEDL